MRRLLTLVIATAIRPHSILLPSSTNPAHRYSFCSAFAASATSNNNNSDKSSSSSNKSQDKKKMYTTNEEDQKEAARLKARLQEQTLSGGSKINVNEPSSSSRIPNVSIDEGANKYVLISAVAPRDGSAVERQNFVVSSKGAEYHRNAAEPMVDALERCGYTSISILGGGRIRCNTDEKKIFIYGFSYGFGLVRTYI